MKKFISLCWSILVILSVSACSNSRTEFDIKIVVPAGSTEDFVYSHEEISPLKDKITIYSGEGLGDTEVVLKPIQVTEKTAYEPTYITHGMPVVMEVEKGGWFKIGVNMQNPTEEDITVYVTVKDIEVRIVEKVVAETSNNSSIKVKENCIAVIGKGTLSQAVDLSKEDTNSLLNITESKDWVEDKPKCMHDCEITLKGNLYYYHSSCGTFEKIDLSKVSTQSSKEPEKNSMLILDEKTKHLVNTLLEKYIELER